MLVFFSMKKYTQIFLLLIHAKIILLVISPTTSYLKTRLFIGISVEELRQWVKDSGTCWCIDTLQGLKDERTNTSTAFQVFFELIHPWCSQEDTFIFKTTWKIKLNFKLFELKYLKCLKPLNILFQKMASHLYIWDCKVN